MTKVAISDAHGVMREGLRALLCSTGEFEFAGEAADGASTLALARATDAALLTLGLSMPGLHGLDLIPLIKIENPSLRILVVTMHPEQAYAVRAFKAGASGYVTKDTPGKDFIAAARKVASGGIYVSLMMADQIAHGFAEVDSSFPHQRLSAREFQILLLIAAGESIAVIAGKLGLSAKTVSTHRTNILEKSGLANDAALVRYAVRHDLLEDDGAELL
ncbi:MULTISPECIES: response regulator [Burkholderiaceae]|jgi:two-component system invasion response regulator UvrY|uniref:DNA-binding NarL/FixJ family response regulator n=3 Tax=Paraburkholderia TaxID=1822464 RepID=A0AAW3V901_9BURK|nr:MULTISPECIES: response regulator transcription factor [Pseudomonadota]OWJ56191.1 DNA-binding response regulator [Burkholderia sp. Bk]ASW04349.1 DNA-binding response regulator [Paraburkholderia aromaticivorans]KVS33605.1 LuxR family transcriptional regulator [Burkholderia vietnamiensis]MBB4519923.1 DNA-binding NarL/FixJ family response regulator [Paraburkholderia fungorum]MBB6206190.1 DNA-binding NarL/FixJ family response regulator [Paraburkholderia fungorum]